MYMLFMNVCKYINYKDIYRIVDTKYRRVIVPWAKEEWD